MVIPFVVDKKLLAFHGPLADNKYSPKTVAPFFLATNLLLLLLSTDLSYSTSDSSRRKPWFFDPCPLLTTRNTWNVLIRSNESVKTNSGVQGSSTLFKYQGTSTVPILACYWHIYTSRKARLTRSRCLVGCWHPHFSTWRRSPAFPP